MIMLPVKPIVRVLAAVLLLCNINAFAQETTPSHVFQNSERIIAEIAILREALGADDYPPDPERQTLKKPIHVYTKALEVLEKIAMAEKRLGLETVEVGQIPLTKIEPKDVYAVTARVLTELQKMKEYLAIATPIDDVPFVAGKAPSHVYENLWRASYMLDNLAGAVKPDDVYRHVRYVHYEIDLIASEFAVSFAGLPEPQIEPKARPKDVAAQGLLDLSKLVRLQKKIGMDASFVPTMTLVRATPSDAFDVANILMAELVRIKVHLGMTTPRPVYPTESGRKPADVLKLMKHAGMKLDRLVANAKRR